MASTRSVRAGLASYETGVPKGSTSWMCRPAGEPSWGGVRTYEIMHAPAPESRSSSRWTNRSVGGNSSAVGSTVRGYGALVSFPIGAFTSAGMVSRE